jgi:Acetyltransferase (GNAT) domain
MSAVDFFEEACSHAAYGEIVDTRQSRDVDRWLHVDALAKRLNFESIPNQPGVYVSRRKASSLTLRWLRQDDFEHWHVLFQACFGHSISKHQWHWKYRDTDRLGIAAFEGTRMVAFYGGMPRQLLAMGRQIAGIQVGDVMVHPDFRNTLSRSGPFQMVASTFLEQNFSPTAPYQLGFGFPNERAFKVAQRLGLYRQVDEVIQINLAPTQSRLMPWLSLTTQSIDALLPSVNSLWVAMQTGFRGSILGFRDVSFFKSRYADPIGFAYEWLALRNRLTGKIHCIAICRQRSEGLEILDMLGHPNTFAQTIHGICGHPSYSRLPNIFMWTTKSHLHLFSRTKLTLTQLGICVPTNCWVPGDFVENIDQRWWLTGGDTDFR